MAVNWVLDLDWTGRLDRSSHESSFISISLTAIVIPSALLTAVPPALASNASTQVDSFASHRTSFHYCLFVAVCRRSSEPCIVEVLKGEILENEVNGNGKCEWIVNCGILISA
ncbi:hypothetical protein PIB30_006953 [Stylosanthes scabra]|uniref:Uncharacterized protein n=1 Tax=Stylosanthes scabra TaxID=79078 RepID=A0ABU6Y110_9FABA|nr:hypothetical protein [Stylosanthes scabra]